jgi:hypothetical protein
MALLPMQIVFERRTAVIGASRISSSKTVQRRIFLTHRLDTQNSFVMGKSLVLKTSVHLLQYQCTAPRLASGF